VTPPSPEMALVLAKPDAVARGRVGEIVARLEGRGLRVVALRRVDADEGRARRLYERWAGRRFFDELVAFNGSGPVVALAVEGPDAARAARRLVGTTDPLGAPPGSIRGRLAVAFPRNAVHATHSSGDAAREIALFWPDGL
jgi:nucleoside-diphosphate kinase